MQPPEIIWLPKEIVQLLGKNVQIRKHDILEYSAAIFQFKMNKLTICHMCMCICVQCAYFSESAQPSIRWKTLVWGLVLQKLDLGTRSPCCPILRAQSRKAGSNLLPSISVFYGVKWLNGWSDWTDGMAKSDRGIAFYSILLFCPFMSHLTFLSISLYGDCLQKWEPTHFSSSTSRPLVPSRGRIHFCCLYISSLA